MLKRSRGFTLIEVIAVVTVVGIMGAVGTPAIFKMLDYFRTKSFFTVIESDLMRARSMAMTLDNLEDDKRVYYGISFDSPWEYTLSSWTLDPSETLVGPGEDSAVAEMRDLTVNIQDYGNMEFLSEVSGFINIPSRIIYNFTGQPTFNGVDVPNQPIKILVELDSGDTGEITISQVTGMPGSRW